MINWQNKMKQSLFYLIVCIGLTGLPAALHAQKNPQNLISGNFQNLTIREFTEEVEQQTHYFFYYDITQFDSFRITLNVDREPLGTVMGLVFKNTAFNFSIGPDNEVFLTKRSEEHTS